MKLSAKGIRALGREQQAPSQAAPYDAQLRGYVAGFMRSPSAVTIEREGASTPEGYHMDFWEEAADGEPDR
ncbi:MAG: hypothetical protein OEW90_01835 [Betaproteobacteria bacterium]|nr:hypothetical protein [Betaproteobacteria bacterium]